MMTIGKCELEQIKDKDILLLTDLVGSKILNVGFAPKDMREYQEGGLTFDYLTTKGEKKRIVLCFNECGMWIPWNGVIGEMSKKEIVLHKLIPLMNERTFIEWEDLGKDWSIKENPLNRSYTFLYCDIEIMDLDINDLKVMYMGKFFGSLDRDIPEIIKYMVNWFELNAPVEMFDLIHDFND